MQKKICNFSRKKLIGKFIILVIFHSSLIFAQARIGLLGGPTASTMSGSFIEGSQGLELGFSGGLVFELEFGQTWSLVSGIHWVQKGGKRLALSTESETYGFQTAYFQLPVLVRIAFPVSNNAWYVAPFTGLMIAAKVGCKYKPGDQFEFEEEPCDETTPGGMPKSLELSTPFGANVWKEYIGGSRFMLEFRYELGWSNVFSVASDAGQIAKHNALIARFGFTLPLN